MSKLQVTIEELISTINHSNLPIIIVEGDDDIVIYRTILSKIGPARYSMIEVGGRPQLFELYKRRNEFLQKSILFIADRDLYVFSDIPQDYLEIFFTEGYSIENDLYIYAKEAIKELFEAEEHLRVQNALSMITEWYSHEIFNYLNGSDFKLDYHPLRLLDRNLNRKFTIPINIESDPQYCKLKTNILQHYYKLLRGKSLFQTLEFILADPNRRVKYKIPQIIDIMLKFGRGQFFIESKAIKIKELFTVANST